MKDFKTLQSEHETLLVSQNRLDLSAIKLKQDQQLLDELNSQGKAARQGSEAAALDAQKAEVTARIQASQGEVRQQTDDLVASTSRYIQEAKTASARIGSPREREQLRANLRYWGSFLYEKTGSYPNTDLAPAVMRLSAWYILWPAVILSVVLLYLFIMTLSGNFPGNQRATATVLIPGASITPSTASYTPPPPSSTRTPDGVTLVPSLTASLSLPTITLTPVVTAILTAVPSATTQATPDLGILVTLTTPADGQSVSPSAIFAGAYTNLQPGWTIHVLLQPKTRPGLSYYPIPVYFTVPAGATSGNWKLSGHFGTGADLEKAEQYNIKVVVATDAESLAQVNQAVTSGLANLPGGVIPFSKVTNVSRSAYQPVNAVRLLYTSINRVEGTSTIVTAALDGSDARPLAHPADVAESFPALSPDGTKIAFVALRRDAKNNMFYSIGLMDSNGDNQRFFFERSDWVYEQPVWSPDGLNLAFSATDRTPFSGGGSTWTVYLADPRAMLNSATPPAPRALTAAIPTNQSPLSSRYPGWLDNNTVIFSQRTANTQMTYQVNINTLDTRVFFDPKGSAAQLALSPDHESVVFIMADDTGPQVYLAFLDPARAAKPPFALTNGATPKQFPAWDPTGQVICFELDQTAKSSIWAVNADGSNLHQVTTGLRTSEIQPFIGGMNAYFPVSGNTQ